MKNVAINVIYGEKTTFPKMKKSIFVIGYVFSIVVKVL